MELVKIYCEYTNVLEEEYYVVNGKKEGVYKKYTPDGNLRKTCYYMNDEINGEFIKYYRDLNGRVHNITNYVNGIKNGTDIIYYTNGDIEAECSYVNGRLEGESKHYYHNYQLHKISYYNQGVCDSTRRSYYKNGNLEKISTFTSFPSKLETKLYYENIDGKIYAIGNSIAGFLDDLIIYFPNGNVKVTFNRIDKSSSEKKVYNETGELIEVINYTNGENFTIDYQLNIHPH